MRKRAEILLIFLTMLPVTGIVPILKVFVMDGFGVSEVQTHLFLALNMVSAFLFAPIAGALADRFGNPRRFVAIAAAADGLLFAAMPFAPSYSVLMILRFVEGFAHIAVLSILLAVAGSNRHVREGARMGMVGAAITFGVALGSPLGGMLGQVSTTLALLTGAVIMFCVAMMAALLTNERSHAARPPLKQVLGTLYQFPALHLPYLFAFLDRFTVGFFVASFPIYAAMKFDFSPAQIGLHIAAFMLTMGILCRPVVRLGKWFSPRTLILAGSMTYGLFFSMIGWMNESTLVWNMIAVGAASAVMFIPTLQLAARAAPDYAKATAMGGFNSAGALGFLLGPIVSGVIFSALKDSLGIENAYATVFFIGGTVEFLVGGIVAVTGWLRQTDAIAGISEP